MYITLILHAIGSTIGSGIGTGFGKHTHTSASSHILVAVIASGTIGISETGLLSGRFACFIRAFIVHALGVV